MKPRPQYPPPPMSEHYRQTFVQSGREGGKKKSQAKAETARANGAKPCREGKTRGRPKAGEKRPPRLPSQILRELPSGIEASCSGCKINIVLPNGAAEVLRAGKRYRWDCADCRTVNWVQPQPPTP